MGGGGMFVLDYQKLRNDQQTLCMCSILSQSWEEERTNFEGENIREQASTLTTVELYIHTPVIRLYKICDRTRATNKRSSQGLGAWPHILCNL